MVDIVDAEVVEMPPERAVVVAPPQQSLIVGGAALASMSDQDFEANLAAMKRGLERVKRIQVELLIDGEDYGKVPGVARPFLQKPGAEKLGKFGGYAVSYRLERHVGDPERPDLPDVEFVAYAQVHLGDTAGPVVAEGVGEANSHETKHRYRRGERMCPNCGKPAIIKGRAEYGGGWVCFKKKDGCGSKWPDGAPDIEGQSTADVENADPWDLANTLAKMAKKRAFVDGMLTATATSGLFTQDDDSPAVAPRTSERTDVDRETGEIRHPVAAAPPEPEVPWSEGEVTLTGATLLNPSSGMGGEIRETPEGMRLGFALALDANRKIPQVIALGALAQDIHDAIGNNGRNLDGLKVTLTGEMFRVPWRKEGRQMPPFQRLILSRIETPTWTLPAEETVASQAADRVAVKRAERVAVAAACGNVAADGLMVGATCAEPGAHKGAHRCETGSWPA